MKNNNLLILGVISILLVVVFISGCTTNTQTEKMIYEHKFNHTSNQVASIDKFNVTLPEGTKKIRVEYQNLTAGGYTNSISGDKFPTLEVYLLNTILPEEQLINADGSNIIDIKRLMNWTGSVTGDLNFTKSGGKSLIITGSNVIGNIKVYVTT